MPDPMFRRTTLLAAIAISAIAPGPARAQNPLALPGDVLLLKTRQWQLRRDRARLQDDIDRGDAAALNHDLRRVRRDEVRVEWDSWMLRSDLFLPLAFTTHPQRIPPVAPNPALILHPQYPGYGYFPSDPSHLYRLPQPASVTSAETPGGASPAPAPAATAEIPIEVVNAGRPGTNVDYIIDGVAYKVEGGRRQKLAVGPASTIAYDRGGGLGEQLYSLPAGVYEFRPADSGWAFVKLRPTP